METIETSPAEESFIRRNRILIGFVAAILFVFAVIGMTLVNGGSPSGPYQFTLKNLDGEDVSLSDFEGQVILVNFWATWCPPCKVEMPFLQTYYDAHKDDGFVLLAIDVNESQAQVDEFITAYGYTFPVLLDNTGDVSQAYGSPGLPYSVVIDREGKVAYRHSGVFTPDLLEQEITPLLTE